MDGTEPRRYHSDGERVHTALAPTCALAYHLEAKACIDEQQHEVSDLGTVDHGRQIVVALEKGQAPLATLCTCARRGSKHITE